MNKTATFRMVGPGGYVVIGFPAAHWVGPDETMTVSDDDEAVRARGEASAQTTADCYRGQPTIWEEVPTAVPAAAPPSVVAQPAVPEEAA